MDIDKYIEDFIVEHNITMMKGRDQMPHVVAGNVLSTYAKGTRLDDDVTILRTTLVESEIKMLLELFAKVNTLGFINKAFGYSWHTNFFCFIRELLFLGAEKTRDSGFFLYPYKHTRAEYEEIGKVEEEEKKEDAGNILPFPFVSRR